MRARLVSSLAVVVTSDVNWVEGPSGDQIAVDEAGAFVGVRQEHAHAVAQALEDLAASL